MVLKSEELLGTLTKEAKERQLRGLKNVGSSLASMEYNGKPVKTSEKIADIARTSRVQVDRLRRVKREAPEKYAEVIDGKKETQEFNCRLLVKNVQQLSMQSPTVTSCKSLPCPTVDPVPSGTPPLGLQRSSGSTVAS